MNARTKLKRVDQARKRRAKKFPGKGWTKVSKPGAVVSMWTRDMPNRRPSLTEKSEEAKRIIGGPTSERKSEPVDWVERLKSLKGLLTQPAPNDNNAGDDRPV